MHLIDEMLLEVAEYLSDHKVHYIFAHLRRDRLIKYYKLKNFYDYKDFFLYPPTRALLTRMICYTVIPRLQYFPKTIMHFQYEIDDIKLTELKIFPQIPDNVIYDVIIYHLSVDLDDIPKNVNSVYIHQNCPDNFITSLDKEHDFKKLKIKCTWFNSPIDNLSKSIEELEINTHEFNQTLDKLPPNLKILILKSGDWDHTLDKLPKYLKKFMIRAYDFNHPLTGIPKTLIDLCIESSEFDHDLLNLPNLIKLKMISCTNFKSKIKFPDTLKELNLRYEISITLDQYGQFPLGLEKLNISDDIELTSTGLQHLKKLKTLHLYCYKKILLPHKLKKLKCNYNYYIDNIIPNTIEILHVNYDQYDMQCKSIKYEPMIIINKLPSNVHKLELDIYVVDNERNKNPMNLEEIRGMTQSMEYVTYEYDAIKHKQEIELNRKLYNEHIDQHLNKNDYHYNSLEVSETGLIGNFSNYTIPQLVLTDDVKQQIIGNDIEFNIRMWNVGGED
jgi:hypothetical protein